MLRCGRALAPRVGRGSPFLPVCAPGVLCCTMHVARVLVIVVVSGWGGAPTLFQLSSGGLRQPFGNTKLSLSC